MKYLILLIVSIMMLVCTSQSYAGGTQHWNDTIIRAGINPRWEAEIYERSRWRNIAFDETFQNCLQLGARYKFSAKFNLLAGYRYDIQDRGGYYEFENRFLLNFSYSLPLLYNIMPKLSQRTELRYFTRASEDHIRLRGKLELSRKLAVLGHKIMPYLAYEIFWDDDARELNRQRLYAGITGPICDKFSIRITWIRQFDKDRDNLDILNSGLNMYF